MSFLAKSVGEFMDWILLKDCYVYYTTCSAETKEPRHGYCQAFYYNNPHKLMDIRRSGPLLKAAAHTGQCTPTHLH